jgi:putative membrane protein
MQPAQAESTTAVDQGPTTLNISTRLAFDRTRLAHDRTMMAWIRTATSLITFGFSVYKFFQIEIKSAEVSSLIGPREFALIMIGLGLLSLALATIQHRRDRTALKALDPEVPRSQAAVLAGLLAILGVLMFGTVLFRQ